MGTILAETFISNKLRLKTLMRIMLKQLQDFIKEVQNSQILTHMKLKCPLSKKSLLKKTELRTLSLNVLDYGLTRQQSVINNYFLLKIVLEYLIPSAGKLYHHKMKLMKLKPDSEVSDALDYLKKKH